jgi:hypothetical protein
MADEYEFEDEPGACQDPIELEELKRLMCPDEDEELEEEEEDE